MEVTDGLARLRGNTGATRMHKALGYSLSSTEMDVVTHSYDPSIPEVEAGRAGVQGHLWLYSEFKIQSQKTKCKKPSGVIYSNFPCIRIEGGVRGICPLSTGLL